MALCCVAGSGPAQATVCAPWTPQVGVSEAGLQHEILRRARELLDAARIQPGTHTNLACGLWWGQSSLYSSGRALKAGSSPCQSLRFLPKGTGFTNEKNRHKNGSFLAAFRALTSLSRDLP